MTEKKALTRVTETTHTEIGERRENGQITTSETEKSHDTNACMHEIIHIQIDQFAQQSVNHFFILFYWRLWLAITQNRETCTHWQTNSHSCTYTRTRKWQRIFHCIFELYGFGPFLGTTAGNSWQFLNLMEILIHEKITRGKEWWRGRRRSEVSNENALCLSFSSKWINVKIIMKARSTEERERRENSSNNDLALYNDKNRTRRKWIKIVKWTKQDRENDTATNVNRRWQK